MGSRSAALKRRRSRSPPRSSSHDSDDERRRRARWAKHETDRGDARHKSAAPENSHHERGSHSYNEVERHPTQRLRSPVPDFSRRDIDTDSTNKIARDRSPYRRSKATITPTSRKNRGTLPSQHPSFQAHQDPSIALVVENKKKEEANFAPTGLLAAASKSVVQADGTAIALKYHEPAEARKPPAKDEWKLFVFKGSDILETINLNTRSCWLLGREVAVVDLPAEHPSISKQHAVIQFRYMEKVNDFGDKLGRVRPYLIDLESANGTLLNKEEIPGSRYLELRDKDMIQFGHSTREYILMLSPKS